MADQNFTPYSACIQGAGHKIVCSHIPFMEYWHSLTWRQFTISISLQKTTTHSGEVKHSIYEVNTFLYSNEYRYELDHN